MTAQGPEDSGSVGISLLNGGGAGLQGKGSKTTLHWPLLFRGWLQFTWEWVKVVQSCLTLCDPIDYTVHGILQAQNTGVGSLPLLQGIFPTQGSNSGLPHCSQILYQLSHKGSPRILEWVAYPFSDRSSPLRNPTGVSCMAGGFFINWGIRELSLTKGIYYRLFCLVLTLQDLQTG